MGPGIRLCELSEPLPQTLFPIFRGSGSETNLVWSSKADKNYEFKIWWASEKFIGNYGKIPIPFGVEKLIDKFPFSILVAKTCRHIPFTLRVAKIMGKSPFHSEFLN